MNTDTTKTATVYGAGGVARYATGARTKTSGIHLQLIRRIGDDVASLREAGDDAAVAGAVRAQREALLDMVAITAPTMEDLDAKQQALVEHTAILEPAYLLDAMVKTALRIDYRALGLTPEQQMRMRAMLPDRLG